MTQLRHIYRLLAYAGIVLASISVGGCYKDRSTEATFEIPELRVSGLDSAMYVLFGQEIQLSVTALQDNRTEEDFSYVWEVDFKAGNSSDRLPLGEEKSVTYKVANTPSSIPYMISCTVTDLQTGIIAVEQSKMYVQSALGEGLLVAHTRNGADYDIDLIANEAITYGYSGEGNRYTRGVYSLVNEETIPDRVLSMIAKYMTNGAVYNDPAILIGTEKHLFRVDPLTFEKGDADALLFNNMKDSEFRTTGMWNCSAYASIAIVNGNLYGNTTHTDNVYSKVPVAVNPTDFIRPDNIAFGRADQGQIMAFNEDNGNFYSMPGAFVSNATMTQLEVPFDMDLSGAKCLGSGPAKSNGGGFLVRTKNDVNYIIYLQPFDNVATAKIVDLPDIDDIVSVAFCDNVDILFYATPGSLYAVTFGSAAPQARKVSWSPDSPDERITMVRHYVQAWWGSMQFSQNAYPFTLPTHRTQVVIVTHNDVTGEGKIYLRPFNMATGMFSYKNNGTFEGFGEISAIAPTFI